MATTKARVTVYLTDEQDKQTRELAELMGLSRTAVVQQAIAQYVLAYGMLQKRLDMNKIFNDMGKQIAGQLQIDLDGNVRDERGRKV